MRDLIAAHELERRRIARDLHDEVGQALTAIRLHLAIILRDPARAAAVAFEAEQAVEIVDSALREVRALAAAIRPAILDDLGLVAAARSSLARQARISGFRDAFECDVADQSFDPELETACFRTLQEALTNISRHAAATEVRVRIAATPVTLLLEVEDDGVGFDPSSVLQVGRRGTSLGLLGLRERAALLGGHLAIESEPGVGTTIRASFPRVDVDSSTVDRR